MTKVTRWSTCSGENYDRTQRLSSEGTNHTLQKVFDIPFSLESAVELPAIIQEELKNTIKSVAKIDKNMHTAAENTKCFRCEGNYKAKSCPFLNKECYFCKFKEHIKNMPKKAEIDAIYLILHPKHPVRELLKAGLYDEIFLSRLFISKEKCRNISGSEMCVVKYYSVSSHNQVSFIRS